MFHGEECLIVGLVFSRLGFWSGNLFLIAPFPDLCLRVPFHNVGNSSVAAFIIFFYIAITAKQKIKKIIIIK